MSTNEPLGAINLRYVIRTPGQLGQTLRNMDVTSQEAAKYSPVSAHTFYKVDYGQRCMPETARAIAQGLWEARKVIHGTEPETWLEILHRLFEPTNLERAPKDNAEVEEEAARGY